MLPLVCLSGLTGCLELGLDAVSIARLDETPPTLARISPPPNGNSLAVKRGAEWTVFFSEEMDPRTLRPGVSLSKDCIEVFLFVAIEPSEGRNIRDLDVEFPVRMNAFQEDGVTPAEAGAYALLFRTLLADRQGNPLAEEQAYALSLEP